MDEGKPMDTKIAGLLSQINRRMAPLVLIAAATVAPNYMLYREERIQARMEREANTRRIDDLRRSLDDLLRVDAGGLANLPLSEGVRRATEARIHEHDIERDRRVKAWVRQVRELNKTLNVPDWE